MNWFRALALSEVSPEAPVKVTVDGVSVLVARDSDGNLFAFENVCPHEDKPLDRGKWDALVGEIRCPFHGAVFCTRNRGLPRTGPTTLPLRMLPVEVRGRSDAAEVFVEIDDEE